MPTTELLEALPDKTVLGAVPPVLRGLAYDSRKVAPGELFVAIPGLKQDGRRFIGDALGRGAAAVVFDGPDVLAGSETGRVLVPSARQALARLADAYFGHPSRALTVIGITGTNGKTTTSILVDALLRTRGGPTGLIGTIEYRIGEERLTASQTTPEALELQSLLARMVEAGVAGVAMEVSSHALDQHRVGGVVFDVAAFTNLSQDHLDYHPSMDDYFGAKAGLFTPAYARAAVVNADDPWGRRLLEAPAIPTRSFAVDAEADLRAEDVAVDVGGIAFRVGETSVRSLLRGRFNVANCLCAIGIAETLGIDLETAARGVAAVPRVPGRVEPVDAGQNFLVVVDYAHTPDSILSVLQAARPLTAGRLIVVFGCGGDRDRAKRPLMGAAATANADLTVITSDNPRSEDPLAIIAAIEAGAREGGGAFVVEADRTAAIAFAVGEAAGGDTVVIAGKGHEPYQEFADRTVPFDDREVAHAAILAAGKGA